MPDGGEYGGFDWLCGQIEGELASYVFVKNFKPDSRADALATIERLQKTLTDIEKSNSCFTILQETAMHTITDRIAHEAGLHIEISERMGKMEYDGTTAFGAASDEVRNALAERNPGHSLFSLAFSLLKEACEVALRDNPPASLIGEILETGQSIVDTNTAAIKGGRPTDTAKQDLVRSLANCFTAATGRRATDTEAGVFDDFLSACLVIIEPQKPDGTSNRKLIRKALEHVPKPRRKN